MIAQLSNSSEVHKLYTNKTTDRQAPASVEVEESGTYQVTILAIRGERGILDSTVEYSELLTVSSGSTDTVTDTSATTTTTFGMISSYNTTKKMYTLLPHVAIATGINEIYISVIIGE